MPEVREAITSADGLETTIRSENILDHVDIEQFTQDEIMEVMSKQGMYDIHVHMKRLEFNLVTIELYRVCLLPSRSAEKSGDGGKKSKFYFE